MQRPKDPQMASLILLIAALCVGCTLGGAWIAMFLALMGAGR